ncbi:hypothetical protein [Streptomyces sp. NPDC056160]|uniref:hypothetical protein n=1 Tax=Streptomyces sp. NPDC056160 TaxID=3345731 RepID=UPI0035E0A4DC
MIAPTIVQEIQTEMATHLLSRTEWDELPAVFTIHALNRQGVRIVQVPVPADVWTVLGHPPTAVAVLAATALGLPRQPDGSHLLVMPGVGPLIGAAFRYEAYAISVASDHPVAQEAARRRAAGGSTPGFKDIPGRVEQRCMTAVDLDGGRYMASSARIDQSRPDAAEPSVHYLAFADPKRDSLTGNVVDAVTRLLNVIKPVPMKPGGTFGRATR